MASASQPKDSSTRSHEKEISRLRLRLRLPNQRRFPVPTRRFPSFGCAPPFPRGDYPASASASPKGDFPASAYQPKDSTYFDLIKPLLAVSLSDHFNNHPLYSTTRSSRSPARCGPAVIPTQTPEVPLTSLPSTPLSAFLLPG